ncbi:MULTISPECIES: AraC family transcriptional regulator [Dehalobacter]|jgi:AraC-like DNA-binding protein|uniref:AraC family transcriptional regulator n=2 Tax=Dehalobacter restrictus TaxID=55583 RepID=A0ABN4BUR9_DEHRP|nr:MULTISPECIES: AraC family transcriptional regulator [Dehalobacter]AHF11123.1 AraC family transcriptional regulator [Dehalobacter restrictus DSM 9455]MDJ0305271.1 AraC family transcriptional regulator [Dehalobacter sp.]
MQQKEIVRKIVETFYGATEITTLYIPLTLVNRPSILRGSNYTFLMDYFEFGEIINFLTALFEQDSFDLNTYHTVITKNFFVYNIVMIGYKTKKIGAVVSGPLIVHDPPEIVLDNILRSQLLSFQKKQEFKTALKTVPLTTLKRIDYLGRFLLVLCKPNIKTLVGSKQNFHCWEERDPKAGYKNLLNPCLEEDRKSHYDMIYFFLKSARDNIIRGDEKGIQLLLRKSGDLLWQTRAYDEQYISSLKLNCIITGSICCLYAIQGNAPYERMMSLLERFIVKINKQSSPEEIIIQMVEISKVFTHAVSVLTCKEYSIHINRALQYIKRYYAEKITLNQLARYLSLSPSYLSSQINKETHLTLAGNINKIRIEQSKDLLLNSNKPIKEIADAVGYNYQNHFNSIFKGIVGMTPLEFRKKGFLR